MRFCGNKSSVKSRQQDRTRTVLNERKWWEEREEERDRRCEEGRR